MVKFIPVSDESAQKLNESLAATVFKTPAGFVEIYNSGIINKRHDSIQAVVENMVKTFKNVKERGGVFIFTSEQEVNLEEALEELRKWGPIVKLKRELSDLVANEDIGATEIIYFNEATAGVFVDRESDTIKLTSERFFASASELKEAYLKWSTVKNAEAEGKGNYPFRASDITSVDDAFINEVRALIPSA